MNQVLIQSHSLQEEKIQVLLQEEKIQDLLQEEMIQDLLQEEMIQDLLQEEKIQDLLQNILKMMMVLNQLKKVIIMEGKNIIDKIEIERQNLIHIQVIEVLKQNIYHHLMNQLKKKDYLKVYLLLMVLDILKENQWLIKLIMELKCQPLLI